MASGRSSTKRAGAISKGWARKFEDPIRLPDGITLRTLRDAGCYMLELPSQAKRLPEWQAAAEALLMAAEDRGPLLHARVGMLRALNRDVEREFVPNR